MRMRIGLMVIVAAVSATQLLATTPPDVEWTVTTPHSCNGNSIAQTSDGGYVITGSCSWGDSAYGNVYLARLDSSGATLWDRNYAGQREEEGCCVVQTYRGGYAIAGWTSDSGMALLIVTDSAGNQLWRRAFDGERPVEAYSVVQLADSGYLLCGASGGDQQLWLARTTKQGSVVWQRTYGASASSRAARAALLEDDGLVLAGWTDSCGTGYFPDDIYVAKADMTGALLWQRVFTGPDFGRAYALSRTPDSGIAVAGTSSTTAGGLDVFLTKLDHLGQSEWSATFGGPGRDFALALAATRDSGYVIAGALGDSAEAIPRACVWRVGATGGLRWSDLLPSGGHSLATSVLQASDRGYVILVARNSPAVETFVTKLRHE